MSGVLRCRQDLCRVSWPPVQHLQCRTLIQHRQKRPLKSATSHTIPSNNFYHPPPKKKHSEGSKWTGSGK